MTFDEHARARMDESVTLLCNLSELVHAGRGATSLKHARIGLDAVQSIYELDDADRAVLSRLITRHRALCDEYMTVLQVANEFKVKPKVIRGLAKLGALDGFRRKGEWLFSPRAVERYAASHTYQCGVLTIAIEEWQRPE